MNIIRKILSAKVFIGLQLIISCVFLYMLVTINILPQKYLIPVIALIIGLLIVNILLQFKAKDISIRSVISRIIAVIVSVGLIIGCVAINQGKNYLAGFVNGTYQTNAMSVIVMASSDYEELIDLNEQKIGINQEEDEENLTTALSEIRENISAEYTSYSDFYYLADSLYDGQVEAIVVNEAYRSMLEEEHEDFELETRVIYQVEIQEEIENIANTGAVNNGVFNICITGIDTYGAVSTRSRSDVNMVMTVNMNTHKIVFTGIPRDYYVTLASFNAKDKLTHSGIYGVNETVNTIANLLDIDIDYYYRINFTSLVNIVDVIGGIDVYSDLTFTPHTNSSITIYEGENHMDGAMALAFSRERYAYASGDRHRIQNQQAVLMAIIEKLITPEILSNYQELLENVEGTFETNMTSEEILTIINYQLSDMTSYEMTNQYLDGTGLLTYGLYSMPNSKLYTMVPNEETVTSATETINEIMNEEVSE
ncbi:MAG: LCP family protein [Erysipelotrichaceae bacterium]|nr:LCP family protein [Erysipelotrichaceae bacterium]